VLRHLLFTPIQLHLLAGKLDCFLTIISFFFERSIHPNQIEAINSDLENDRMVRALYDIKATDMGSQSVMFKAEVDIDGREITRSYLEKIDIQVILEVKEKINK
jgi:hypothetical protein